jgi:hypothetical protein
MYTNYFYFRLNRSILPRRPGFISEPVCSGLVAEEPALKLDLRKYVGFPAVTNAYAYAIVGHMAKLKNRQTK